MSIATLVQFFLIDHVLATGLFFALVCGAAKLHIIRTCKSHPLYRGDE